MSLAKELIKFNLTKYLNSINEEFRQVFSKLKTFLNMET